MPMLLDTETRTDCLVRAINDVLIDQGPAGLSLRRIARASGVSTSSILHHLGSREHLLRVAAHRTARARVSAFRSLSAVDGALAFLPQDAEELLDTRAWLAWLELWRAEDSLERVIREGREDERALLAGTLEYRLPGPDLDALMALIEGLRIAVCGPGRPMRREVAREILTSRCHTFPGAGVLPAHDPSRRTA